MNLRQLELAKLLDIPFRRVNMIVNEKRAVTPDTALRLSRLFGTTVDFWMNFPMAWDVYEAEQSPEVKTTNRIERLRARAG